MQLSELNLYFYPHKMPQKCFRNVMEWKETWVQIFAMQKVDSFHFSVRASFLFGCWRRCNYTLECCLRAEWRTREGKSWVGNSSIAAFYDFWKCLTFYGRRCSVLLSFKLVHKSSKSMWFGLMFQNNIVWNLRWHLM